MIKALIHRYDNEPDILDVKVNMCSEVYKRSANDDFDYVIVIPTGAAKTTKAVIASALSRQYPSDGSKHWSGRPDRYKWRVDLANVRYITIDEVKRAFDEAGAQWAGQWAVKHVRLPLWLVEDDQKLYPIAEDDELPNLAEEDEEPSATEGLLTEVVYYKRSRDRALRDQALRASKGVCAVCETDYSQWLEGKGIRVLQVHHRQQLAMTDAPVITRLSDLAVVCANCHMLIHMDSKQALTIEALRAMLGKNTAS